MHYHFHIHTPVPVITDASPKRYLIMFMCAATAESTIALYRSGVAREAKTSAGIMLAPAQYQIILLCVEWQDIGVIMLACGQPPRQKSALHAAQW